jgi:hypothetical protein
MSDCPHNYRRDVETCPICEAEEERDEERSRRQDATREVRRLEGLLCVARADNARLRELVREMATDWLDGHSERCLYDSKAPCVCGMDDLLQRIDAELGRG